MECNKDEALRAKQLAEMKMEKNDFEGARKIAQKAQNLYPELENINQLISICDVHCSAQKRILGPEKDWYGILQVEKFADEVTIKKQYRRLALHLHPDKNRFPGAEAAFKFICEANTVLSDPTKKSVYDSKIRVTARSAVVNPPPHYMNRNTQFNKQHVPQNIVPNGFSSMNQHQATRPRNSVRREVFWTCCPFCSSRYQYDRKFVNTSLCCQKCSKYFTGYEISVQGSTSWVPPNAQHLPRKPSANPSDSFQEKGVPKRGNFTMGVQNDQGFSGPQQSASRKPVRSQPAVRTENVFPGGIRSESDVKVNGDLNGKEKHSHGVNSSRGRKEGGTGNGGAFKRETGKNKTKKRGRKMVVESSESFEISSESDLEDVTMEGNFSDPANMKSGPSNVHFPRRSSRKRQHVSYNEGADDDLLSTDKKSQASELSEDNVNEQNDDFNNEASKDDNQSSFATEEDFSKSETKEMGIDPTEKSLGDKDADVDTVEIDDNSDKGVSHCADTEFYDFNKDRDEHCFAANQFWALYDDHNDMPRFYCKVTRVRSSPFGLNITWLEADPIDEAQKKWFEGGLPVSCGNFRLGKTIKTSNRLTFSHKVHCDKGRTRGSLIMYPKKGEVWALYKDCDISWTTKPEKHKDFKYEVVEVLADFDAVAGIKVCYLDKIGGFVSLFQRSGIESFQVGPNELYKFSHRIPCFKTSGSEKEGVPVGSVELDPASLPLDLDDVFCPGKEKMKSENIDAGVNVVKPAGKFVDVKGTDEDMLKSRRSTRGSKCKV